MGTKHELPDELIQFVNQYLQSIRQLETLLLFHSNPSREWTAKSATKELSANESAIAKWLKEFADAQILIEKSGSELLYQYRSDQSDRSRLVSLLAQEYRIRPLKVIDLIINKPTNKMMSFLEAFKIKKDGADDDS